jgi:hypothetical protein
LFSPNQLSSAVSFRFQVSGVGPWNVGITCQVSGKLPRLKPEH